MDCPTGSTIKSDIWIVRTNVYPTGRPGNCLGIDLAGVSLELVIRHLNEFPQADHHGGSIVTPGIAADTTLTLRPLPRTSARTSGIAHTNGLFATDARRVDLLLRSRGDYLCLSSYRPLFFVQMNPYFR